ncbi:MAG: hypothetical protein AAF718_00315 [Pseudomonadota bacterium]
MTDFDEKDYEDFVSIAFAVQCLLENKSIEPDFAKPNQRFSFPNQSPIFEALIRAAMAGDIECRGCFADVRLDLPALEGDIEQEDVVQSCSAWRARGDIRLGCGQEAEFSIIPPDAWWYEGAIWEQSALWIGTQDKFENRRKNLKVERTVPSPPDRPYDFEQILCFLEVKFRLSELKRWARVRSRDADYLKPLNERGAGMKPTENYAAIIAHLEELLKTSVEWVSWMDVWHDVRHLFRRPEEDEKREQPHKKMEKYLAKHKPDLLEKVRDRIQNVRRRAR